METRPDAQERATHPEGALKRIVVKDLLREFGIVTICTACNEQVGKYEPLCQHPTTIQERVPATGDQKFDLIREICTSCQQVVNAYEDIEF